ncbi:MAG: prepilin-type N-terminal cleavage/methylation domain-containing protein [Elusimicrobia bacterium]|nr:prepilin-type N-terminal cleavage/methylation domain-containing protein [Elusimicrobiota bacterium]
MIKNFKAFTLVEMIVAVVLSSILIFFAYTMTISAYRIFSRMSDSSKNSNSIRFFEESFRKSVKGCTEWAISSDKRTIAFLRYDPNIKSGGDWVVDKYTFDSPFTMVQGASSISGSTSYSPDVEPEKVPGSSLKSAANLYLQYCKKSSPLYNASAYGSEGKILVLSGVRYFYFTINKQLSSYGYTGDLKDISIGIVYDEKVNKFIKRKNKAFCFTSRGYY